MYPGSVRRLGSMSTHLFIVRLEAMLRFVLTLAVLLCASEALGQAQTVKVKLVDADTGEAVAARVYLQTLGERPSWRHVKSVEGGEAIEYHVVRDRSIEVHTSVSAHGFQVELAPGRYRLTVERGKEYVTAVKEFAVEDQALAMTLPLERWIDMSALGWYCGETHIHRPLGDLKTGMAAEDLNVGFPLTYWVTDSRQTPARDRRSNDPDPEPNLVEIDATHVYWPINTEYELFTIEGQRHTLGALFFLNHHAPIDLSAPPIVPVVESLQDEPRLLMDMDKHNWPWSMMLVPTTGVNLFELTNNHLWRTEFKFGDWYPDYVPEFFDVEKDADGAFTEQGWLDYGLQTYYMLLNCGYRIRPTGGTASGVHPVPIGFGRAYVHLGEEFEFDAWVDGLAEGRSFVTTGPMMDIRFAGEHGGTEFSDRRARLERDGEGRLLHVTGRLASDLPIDRIEYVINGAVHRVDVEPRREDRAWVAELDLQIPVEPSCWVAVRCFSRTPEGRPRFAHSAPVYVLDESQPIRPSRKEVAFLVRRMQEEIDRHEGVLTEEAINEFRAAQAEFESLRQED